MATYWHGLHWRVHRDGIRATAAALLRRIARAVEPTSGVRPTTFTLIERSARAAGHGPDEAPPPASTASIGPDRNKQLGLQPGELVRVKSAQEILHTLDANGRTRGLEFMAEMQSYLGKELRVRKRVELIRLENAPAIQVRKVSQTVLLEGAICEGTGAGCDRCCYFMWREDWLKRV